MPPLPQQLGVTPASWVLSSGGLGKPLCLPNYFLRCGQERTIVGPDMVSVKCLAGAGCLGITNSRIDVEDCYYLMIIVV